MGILEIFPTVNVDLIALFTSTRVFTGGKYIGSYC